jgi:DNA polymerase III delta subunit
MLYLFFGTDREKARAALKAALKKTGGDVVRVSDASTLADLQAALQGGGMFGGKRAVVLEGIFANEEMRTLLDERLDALAASTEPFFILEEKLDAPTRKRLEKRAQKTEAFDAPKAEREDNFFALVNALRAGSKKDLWVLLQRELLSGKAPEMLHGSLFWGAKQMVLKPRKESDAARGKTLVAALAELPHAARRRGEELDYALERFVLSGM